MHKLTKTKNFQALSSLYSNNAKILEIRGKETVERTIDQAISHLEESYSNIINRITTFKILNYSNSPTFTVLVSYNEKLILQNKNSFKLVYSEELQFNNQFKITQVTCTYT